MQMPNSTEVSDLVQKVSKSFLKRISSQDPDQHAQFLSLLSQEVWKEQNMEMIFNEINEILFPYPSFIKDTNRSLFKCSRPFKDVDRNILFLDILESLSQSKKKQIYLEFLGIVGNLPLVYPRWNKFSQKKQFLLAREKLTPFIEKEEKQCQQLFEFLDFEDEDEEDEGISSVFSFSFREHDFSSNSEQPIYPTRNNQPHPRQQNNPDTNHRKCIIIGDHRGNRADLEQYYAELAQQFDDKINSIEEAQKTITQMMNILKSQHHDIQSYHQKMQTLINLNVLQEIYQKATLKQKQSLQHNLCVNPVNTLSVIQNRLQQNMQILLQGYSRIVHTRQIDQKYLQDFQINNVEFKFLERRKCNDICFKHELVYLTAQLEVFERYLPKQQQKMYTLRNVNSLQIIEQKINPSIEQQINVKLFKPKPIKKVLPIAMFNFENKSALGLTYCYIQSFIKVHWRSGTAIYCRFLRQILAEFLNFQETQSISLNQRYNEQQFINSIDSADCAISSFAKCWIDWLVHIQQQEYEEKPLVYDNQDLESEQKGILPIPFQPAKNKNKLQHVWFSSEQLYFFIRYLHILYQRLICLQKLSPTRQQVDYFTLTYLAFLNKSQKQDYNRIIKKLFKTDSKLFENLYMHVENVTTSLNRLLYVEHNFASLSLSKHFPQEAEYFRHVASRMKYENPSFKLIRSLSIFAQNLVYVNCCTYSQAYHQVDSAAKSKSVENNIYMDMEDSVMQVRSTTDKAIKSKKICNRNSQK